VYDGTVLVRGEVAEAGEEIEDVVKRIPSEWNAHVLPQKPQACAFQARCLPDAVRREVDAGYIQTPGSELTRVATGTATKVEDMRAFGGPKEAHQPVDERFGFTVVAMGVETVIVIGIEPIGIPLRIV
jgi:hypothetical protein